jgi:hypothetical protein
MSDEKKPTTFRVYLGDDDEALLREICNYTELGQTELLSKIAVSGIRAIMANSRHVSLPLRFVVETQEPEPYLVLRDKPKPKK